MTEETTVIAELPPQARKPDRQAQAAIAGSQGGLGAPTKASTRPVHRVGGRFAEGNQAAKGPKSNVMIEAPRIRHKLVREMKGATPVRRMFDIIEGDDPKASIMAFKALFDTIGIRTAIPEEGAGKPTVAFTFVLPAAGTIPVEAKPVTNLAEPVQGSSVVLELPEALEVPVEVPES